MSNESNVAYYCHNAIVIFRTSAKLIISSQISSQIMIINNSCVEFIKIFPEKKKSKFKVTE